ncbi:leucine-rich repeat domain-containing protein [Bengtsoniella intestinalis]|uniref:leucine-rich repeat domain-containing protein n=1 Tax=Bengtsoniella intestinalis TaxID=3073143 RepID=UPI00391FC4C7
MTKEEIVATLKRCIEKAGLWQAATLDEDEIAYFYLDADGRFYLDEIKTPYGAENFVSIKFRAEQAGEEASIRIIFDDEVHLWVEPYKMELCGNGASCRDEPSTKAYLRNFAKAKDLGALEDEYVVVDNRLIRYNGSGAEAVVPDGVTVIEDDVFANQKGLETVVLPETLLEIKERVFHGCASLTNVVLPQRLEQIGRAAFANCEALSQIDIPESVRHVDAVSFGWCAKLEEVMISTQTKVDEDAFLQSSNCKVICG